MKKLKGENLVEMYDLTKQVKNTFLFIEFCDTDLSKYIVDNGMKFKDSEHHAWLGYG